MLSLLSCPIDNQGALIDTPQLLVPMDGIEDVVVDFQRKIDEQGVKVIKDIENPYVLALLLHAFLAELPDLLGPLDGQIRFWHHIEGFPAVLRFTPINVSLL